MCSALGPKSREHKLHLCYSPDRNDSTYDSPFKTFVDTDLFASFAEDLSETMDSQFSINVDKNEYYSINKQNIVLRMINRPNGFVMRFECGSFFFPLDKIAKIKAIADCINRHF